MTLSRRSFLSSMLAAAAAPQFVRRESLGGLWVPSWHQAQAKPQIYIQAVDTMGNVGKLTAARIDNDIVLQWSESSDPLFSHYEIKFGERLISKTTSTSLLIPESGL